MRFSTLSLVTLLLVSAAPAFAQDDTAPPPAFTVNGTAAVVSDYRFRGISQTDINFALQGSITITHQSGFYASVWGSTVDDYVTASGASHQEFDIIGGFKKTVSGTTFDVGALYYVYPKTRAPGDRTSSNFIEPYVAVSHLFGPLTAKATANYAPRQKALALDQIGPANDNLYLAGDFSIGVPKTPVSISAHIAHNFGPSWLSIGNGYTDWNLGASYTWKALTFGVQYVDTDGSFITPTGRNASRAGVVGSITASF